MIPPEASLLRVYSKAIEKWQGVPLYRAIVEAARRRHLAGASVFPVELGYGSHRQLHDIASEYASFDIPIVVEIVDAAERVGELVAELETMVERGPCNGQPGPRAPLYPRGPSARRPARRNLRRVRPSHPGGSPERRAPFP